MKRIYILNELVLVTSSLKKYSNTLFMLANSSWKGSIITK